MHKRNGAQTHTYLKPDELYKYKPHLRGNSLGVYTESIADVLKGVLCQDVAELIQHRVEYEEYRTRCALFKELEEAAETMFWLKINQLHFRVSRAFEEHDYESAAKLEAEQWGWAGLFIHNPVWFLVRSRPPPFTQYYASNPSTENVSVMTPNPSPNAGPTYAVVEPGFIGGEPLDNPDAPMHTTPPPSPFVSLMDSP